MGWPTSGYAPQRGVWLWTSNPTGPYNENVYQFHTFHSHNNTPGAQHSYQMTKAMRNLYGKGNYAVAIGELGWGIWEQEGQGNTYPGVTADVWGGVHFDELIDADVVFACFWKQMGDGTIAEVESSGSAMGGRLRNRAADPQDRNAETDDPRHVTWGNDCRRKGMVAMFKRPEQVGPRALP